MGNYCSSSSKKDKDNKSDKSDDSPSYQLAKSKKHNGSKEAPLADPEPTSDISNQQAPAATNNGHSARKSIPAPLDPLNVDPTLCAPHAKGQLLNTASESITNSPLTGDAPPDTDVLASATKSPLPVSLQSLHGERGTIWRTERDRKIVLYVMAADGALNSSERATLKLVVDNLRQTYAARGFEVLFCDLHASTETDFLDIGHWLAAGSSDIRGGYHQVAPSINAITRYIHKAYFVPVLFLGNTLGSSLLPLSIERRDFESFIAAAKTESDRTLLNTWYSLNETDTPHVCRLRSDFWNRPDTEPTEALRLLNVLVDVVPEEIRHSYLTTFVEQEINSTVLIHPEHSRRCVWIQTGSWPNRQSEAADALEIETNRRLDIVHSKLKSLLPEKNLIRIPPTVQVPPEQLAQLLSTLLAGVCDGIADEHATKCQVPRCTFGVDYNLLHEIEAEKQYSMFLRHYDVDYHTIDAKERIKSYLTHPSSEPMIVCGNSYGGKTVFAAQIGSNIHKWLPGCSFIVRYTNLTLHSSDIVSILGSIAEQVCYLTKNKSCFGPHTVEFYATTLRDCLQSTSQQICIILDSIDAAAQLQSFDWLPLRLQDNVKIILTISNDCVHLNWLQEHLPANSFLQLNSFTDEQWSSADWRADCVEKIPFMYQLYLWLEWSQLPDDVTTTDEACTRILEFMEQRFDRRSVELVLSLLASSRYGLKESDLLLVLGQQLNWPDWKVTQFWIQFAYFMGPLLAHSHCIRLWDRKLRSTIAERYSTDGISYISEAHRLLQQFYESTPDEYRTPPTETTAKKQYTFPNVIKFRELPYHASQALATEAFEHSSYLTNIEWIYSKLSAIGCVPLLSDLQLCSPQTLANSPAHRLLLAFLQLNARPLNYDARQFYSLMPEFVRHQCETDDQLATDPVIAGWLRHFERIPVAHFETLGNLELLNEQRRKGSSVAAELVEVAAGAVAVATAQSQGGYDAVMNLDGEGYFVASLSVAREEICVWDVARCERVRTMRGIPQPTVLCPVGGFRAAVLCRREIKVIDLDEGAFKVTLKGVMNQKMPFFGQHDAQHLVCLSRNRMYVNLMNLESGDCVTTFKAGEDRFLNSLLVSGDGRILVCGDETQKPFPLLVWHLTQRKLLYDLRIPHHDFVTTLSAITHEGAYVAVVTKELSEPSPNFIVVYDLQSGTMFKKWKPSCSTVALAISQTNNCVIAGLEDARILIWDLVTGNCKYTLSGHTAPVTLLKLDPTGRVLLSGDREGKDLSVRVWELSSGNTLAVYTSAEKITTCEILPHGKFIVLAVHNHPNLVTLRLHKAFGERATADDEAEELADDAASCYGRPENEGKVSQL